MMHLRTWVSALLVVASVVSVFDVSAQSEDKNAQKAARRSQLQLQSLRQQVQDAQAAQAKVEADKAALGTQLAEQTKQSTRLDDALRKASSSLKASEAARMQLLASVAALEKQLAEQKQSSDDLLAQKAKEAAQLTRLRDEQQLQLQRRHDDQTAQVAECTAKNGRLIQLSAELLDRYRKKGIGEMLQQRDPLLGLGDVEMFNLAQDFRDRADAQRFTPVTAPPDVPPTPSAVPGQR
jgi:chromosome segregation ATPase